MGTEREAGVTRAQTGPPRPDKDSEDRVPLERIRSLCDEGRAIWRRFDSEVRSRSWHPFVPADYDRVLSDLLSLRRPGARFLELGSASGVVTIMADLLGFAAYGIEIDPDLVAVARSLARRHRSDARFAAGSFVPSGYVWKSETGDDRLGTLALGEAAYADLGRDLSYFDVVFAYPWDGEEPVLRDIMRRHGAAQATLLLYGPAARVDAAGDSLASPPPR